VGIHDYLRYDGIVVLSSIIHDRFLMKSGVISKYVELVRSLEPDIAVTLSHSAYVDDPCFVGTNAVLWSIKSAGYMSRLDIPLIAFVVGGTDDQIELCTEGYAALGYVDFALGCRELLIQKQVGLISKWIKLVKNSGGSCLLLGASHPNLFSKLPHADSYTGLAWFHNAVNGKKYSASAVPNVTGICNCVHCTRHDLVGHNLALTVSSAEAQQKTLDGYGVE
jgi:hypothetical protein